MIAPLRRRHRLTTSLLAIVVPVLYLVALGARPEEPIMQVPAALADVPAGEIDQDFGELFTDPPLVVRARRSGSSSASTTSWWLEIAPEQPVVHPETLVYWTEVSDTADRLPEDAYLLGGMAGARARAFNLPESVLGRTGSLVLYSLGAQKIVAASRLPAIGQAPATRGPEVGP